METAWTLSRGSEGYVQGPGVTARVGEEAAHLGKMALIISGNQSWAAAEAVVSASLERHGIAFERHAFSGYCSERNVNEIMEKAKALGADMVIGAGGGKCMDTTKSVGELAGIPCILIPTSCATCASDVRLCVWYTDEGVCAPGLFVSRSAAAVLVDTTIIGAAPVRLLASGMADALAKFPELDHSCKAALPAQRTTALEAATALARCNMELLLKHGPLAMMEAAQKKPGFHMEQVVGVAIGMTGITSNLVAGTSQQQIAHMFHDGVASLFHDARTAYMHGEIVAVGILLQMAATGYPADFSDRIRQFLLEIGAPVCMSQIGIEPTGENRETLYRFILGRGFDRPEMRRPIWDAFETILK